MNIELPRQALQIAHWKDYKFVNFGKEPQGLYSYDIIPVQIMWKLEDSR
jgi:hypothetical protein